MFSRETLSPLPKKRGKAVNMDLIKALKCTSSTYGSFAVYMFWFCMEVRNSSLAGAHVSETEFDNPK